MTSANRKVHLPRPQHNDTPQNQRIGLGSATTLVPIIAYLSWRRISSEISPSDEYAFCGSVWQSASNSGTSSSASTLSSRGSDSARDLVAPRLRECCSKN